MKTFVWAFVGAVAVMGAASAAPAPDCHEEVNAPGDLATTMLAIKVGEAIREQYEVLFADPTGDTAALWIAAAIKAVEPVTKRKSGVTVRRYAADQAENVLKLAPVTKRKRDAIMLLDADERETALMAFGFGVMLGNQPSLLQPLEVIVKASLSSCNKDGAEAYQAEKRAEEAAKAAERAAAAAAKAEAVAAERAAAAAAKAEAVAKAEAEQAARIKLEVELMTPQEVERWAKPLQPGCSWTARGFQVCPNGLPAPIIMDDRADVQPRRPRSSPR